MGEDTGLDLNAIERELAFCEDRTSGWVLKPEAGHALIAEVRALRERVATLEDGVREFLHAPWFEHDELRTAKWDDDLVKLALLDTPHDQEGTDHE